MNRSKNIVFFVFFLNFNPSGKLVNPEGESLFTTPTFIRNELHSAMKCGKHAFALSIVRGM